MFDKVFLGAPRSLEAALIGPTLVVFADVCLIAVAVALGILIGVKHVVLIHFNTRVNVQCVCSKNTAYIILREHFLKAINLNQYLKRN